MKLVTIYVRKNCLACQDALRVIQGVRDRHPFELRTVDIEADLAAEEVRRRKLGLRIPVVEVDGREVFENGVSAVKLAEFIQAAREGA